jgi:hypothetical protein
LENASEPPDLLPLSRRESFGKVAFLAARGCSSRTSKGGEGRKGRMAMDMSATGGLTTAGIRCGDGPSRHASRRNSLIHDFHPFRHPDHFAYVDRTPAAGVKVGTLPVRDDDGAASARCARGGRVIGEVPKQCVPPLRLMRQPSAAGHGTRSCGHEFGRAFE